MKRFTTFQEIFSALKNNILRNIIIVILVIAFLATLLLILYKAGLLDGIAEWFRQTWIWLVGLAGGIGLTIKKIWESVTGKGSSLKEISKSNEELKKQLEHTEEKIRLTNERYELEKQLFRKDMELLQLKLEAKEKEFNSLTNKLSRLEDSSDEEYYDGLSQKEKDRIQRDIEEHTGPSI